MGWSWLSLVVGLLAGWLVEWLIDLFYWRRRYRAAESANAGVRARLDAARAEQDVLEAQLVVCQKGSKTREEELAVLQARLVEAEAALEAARTEQAAAASRAQELAAQLAAAEAAIPPKPQDLTRIEGIGPAISQVLNDAGIVNYAQLADAAVDRLRDLLKAAGPRFQIAQPATWPQQARLAAEERWDELQALQDELTAGRRSPASGAPVAAQRASEGET